MPDERSFIEAILESPDDDGLRLIYADWLDENGQGERAEFIRCQIAHEWYPGGPMEAFRAGRDQEELARRERELLDPFGFRWLAGGFPGWSLEWGNKDPSGLTFRVRRGQEHSHLMLAEFHRGFVDVFICTAEDWLQHAKAILLQQPIREVRLTTMPQMRVSELGHGYLPGQLARRYRLQIGEREVTVDLEDSPSINNQAYALTRLLNFAFPKIKFTLPPSLNAEYIGDLVQTALRELSSQRWTDIARNLQRPPRQDTGSRFNAGQPASSE